MMDTYEMKLFRNGFMAINENLTDIAASLRKISESLDKLSSKNLEEKEDEKK